MTNPRAEEIANTYLRIRGRKDHQFSDFIALVKALTEYGDQCRKEDHQHQYVIAIDKAKQEARNRALEEASRVGAATCTKCPKDSLGAICLVGEAIRALKSEDAKCQMCENGNPHIACMNLKSGEAKRV